MKVNICGVKIDNYSFNDVIERIIDHAVTGVLPSYVELQLLMHNTF